MVSFDLSDEQKLVQETVASFAADRIEPIMRESDESQKVSLDIIAKGWELGLLGDRYPKHTRASGKKFQHSQA